MSEDHRLNEAETRCKPGGQQRGDSGKDVCTKKHRTERTRIHTEAKVKPIGSEALNDEGAAESIEGELRNVLILRALERQYYKLTAVPGNPALSLQVIAPLAPLYGEHPGDWARRFEELFTEKETVLRSVFDNQAGRLEQRSAFFFQPEVLMIYDRLLND